MKFLRFFKNFYSIYVGIIVLLLVFVAPFIKYTFKRNYCCLNYLHVLAGIAIAALCVLLVLFVKKRCPKIMSCINSRKGFNTILCIGFAIMLLLELAICTNAWFIVGWDVRNVTIPEMQMDSDYMSMYPNQLFLAGVFRRTELLLQTMGIFNPDVLYFSLVILAMISVALSIFFITRISKKLTNNLCAICTFLLAAVFLGLSPWIMVPYSDNFSMLFVTFVLFMYVCVDKPAIKWFLIFFGSLVGYAIKPTAIFVLMSILFVEAVRAFAKFYNNKKLRPVDAEGYYTNMKTSLIERVLSKIPGWITQNTTENEQSTTSKIPPKSKTTRKRRITKAGIIVLAAGLGVFSAVLFTDFVSDYGVEVHEQDSFGPSHFLMMGLSLETQGAWNNDDVNISRSFSNTDERTSGNIKEWLVRVKTLGPGGVLRTYFLKTLTNYGDGTFSWEAETPWNIKNKGGVEKTDVSESTLDNSQNTSDQSSNINPGNPQERVQEGLASIVWGFYGIDWASHHDDNNNWFDKPWAAMWFIILIGAFLSILYQRPKRGEIVMACSMLCISAFLMLFEPDPRYMILYSPLLVLFGVWGWWRAGKLFAVSKLGTKLFVKGTNSEEKVYQKVNPEI